MRLRAAVLTLVIGGGAAAADNLAPTDPAMTAPMTEPALAAPGMTAPELSTTATASTSESSRPQFGVGYLRGTGLGYYGASIAMKWTDNVTPQLHAFGFFDDGSRGFALVPALRLCTSNGRWSPCLSGGVQYLRMWFGDASGGGFGGYGTVGVTLRFEPIEIELGLGAHGKQSIKGSDGAVSVAQSANFGPHWEAGLRYWFGR